MTKESMNLSIAGHTLFTADDLRPALLLTIGQIILAFLGAILVTNGLLM